MLGDWVLVAIGRFWLVWALWDSPEANVQKACGEDAAASAQAIPACSMRWKLGTPAAMAASKAAGNQR